MRSMTETSPATDVIEGVDAIAAFIGQPKRRTNYLLERGVLPAGKLGTRWVASKSKLAEFYAKLTSGTAA